MFFATSPCNPQRAAGWGPTSLGCANQECWAVDNEIVTSIDENERQSKVLYTCQWVWFFFTFYWNRCTYFLIWLWKASFWTRLNWHVHQWHSSHSFCTTWLMSATSKQLVHSALARFEMVPPRKSLLMPNNQHKNTTANGYRDYLKHYIIGKQCGTSVLCVLSVPCCASIGWNTCVLATLFRQEKENVTPDIINTVKNCQRLYLFWINFPFKEMSDEAAKESSRIWWR